MAEWGELLADYRLLTVEEVAGLLKVPRSWVYERTRRRGRDRLPHLKLGKYLRFEERAVMEYLRRCCFGGVASVGDRADEVVVELAATRREHEEPTRGKESSRMAKKRPYGSGYLKQVNGNWTIRWRESEVGTDGKVRRVLRYENLGRIKKSDAARILNERIAGAENEPPKREEVSFSELAAQWRRTVLPMYKHSTRKNHEHILDKHLLPRFRDLRLRELTAPLPQSHIAHLDRKGYAPKTIDHIHDVLSAVLRTGVKWGYLPANPAQGLDLPSSGRSNRSGL